MRDSPVEFVYSIDCGKYSIKSEFGPDLIPSPWTLQWNIGAEPLNCR